VENDNKYVKESEKYLREAKTFARTYGSNIETIYSTIQRRVVNALRTKMVENLEEIQIEVLKMAKEKEEEIQKYPHLYAGKEVWVSAFPYTEFGESRIGFDATEMKRESAWAVAKKMENTRDVRYLPKNVFVERMRKLKAHILNGSLDDILKKNVKTIVYEIMSDKGKLWSTIRND
jgi:hypothetical protein